MFPIYKLQIDANDIQFYFRKFDRVARFDDMTTMSMSNAMSVSRVRSARAAKEAVLY